MKKQIPYILVIILISLTVTPVPVFAALDFGVEVGNMLALFGAYIFSFVALLFKYAIDFLVFGIGDHMSGQLGFVVNTVWSILRDLCNLMFIFLFLFIGIRLVLTVESTEGARKALVPLLIAALLVNFSLFFAKAIIDLANVAAVAVYGLFGTGSDIDVAAKIAGSLGLQSWFGSTPKTLEGMSFSTGIMMMIFFLVAAIAFLTATVMLVKRYVVLLLGMIISPLVLVFKLVKNVPVLSSFEKKTQAGFSMFISSAFYPAVFLFLIYLATQIVGSYAGGAEFSKAIFEKDGNAAGTILVYCIGIALLFVAMKSASMISDSAANMTMSFARKAGGAATLGAAAFAGRQTLGRLGKAAQEGGVSDALRTSGINRSRLGRLVTTSALGGIEKVRTGSYEVRNTKAYESAAKTVGAPIGGGWSVTDKGFEDVRKEKVKKETDLAEKQAAILAGTSKEKQKEKEEKAKKEYDEARQNLKEAKEYRKDIEERNKAITRSGGTVSSEQQAELTAADVSLNKLFATQKEKKEENEKVRNEYKEKVTSVMYGTEEARQTIKFAETASQHAVAQGTHESLIKRRSDTMARMVNASPQERVALQTEIINLDKKIGEQEKVIESAQIATEKTVSAEHVKSAAEIAAQVSATKTALTGTEVGSATHTRLQTELASLQEKAVEVQRHVDAPVAHAQALASGDAELVRQTEANYSQELDARKTSVAQRMRDAAKAARNMKRKQGGISGSLETEVTARDTASAVVKGTTGAMSSIATLGKSNASVNIGQSTVREAGAKLREKNVK